MPQKMIVELSSPEGKTRELIYDIRNSTAAKAWAHSLEQALSEGFRETDRFYEFPNNPRSNLEEILSRLENVISKLKTLHPELGFPNLDRSDLANSLNHLHLNFADSHLVNVRITEVNGEAWSQFNELIHAAESAMRGKHFQELAGGLPTAHVVFTFKKPFHVPIPEESFNDFTFAYDFGAAYINYAHVGRHFSELFHANDDHALDEHIQPAKLLSADTLLYFGPTSGHFVYHRRLKMMEEWFEKRKERFNRLGFFWNDPKIALGLIPVARLQNQIYLPGEVKSFVQELSQMTAVSRVRLE